LINNICKPKLINVAQDAQDAKGQVYQSELFQRCLFNMNNSPQPEAPQSDVVKIRLKHNGWEVEITCAENKVKEVVRNVLDSIDHPSPLDEKNTVAIGDLQKQVENIRMLIGSDTIVPNKEVVRREKKSPHKSGMTCRILLETLWEEGYFANQRLLAEIHEELLRRGYSYDRTAVSHSLTDMVREGIIIRNGTARNYVYLQKTPKIN
jgi:hypothetical protein